MTQSARMEMCKSLSRLERHLPSKHWIYSRVNALRELGKVWTQNREHETKVSAVWSIEPELLVGHCKQAGSGDAGMARDRRTGFVCGRLSGGDDLQGDPPIREGVSSKPDGGETAEPELVDDSVPTIVLLAEVYWVEASRLIVLEVFAFPQLERQILPPTGFRI